MNYFALLFVLLSGFLYNTNAQFRVLCGRDIVIEKSRHSVAIFRIAKYICVGSLVNMKTVVTAAHCLKDEEEDKLALVAGITYLHQRARGQTRDVQDVFYDPAYDQQTKLMDIAVVKVKTPFREDTTVKSIPLCDDRLLPGMTIQVSGWGQISELSSKVYPNHLKTRHVNIVDTRECKTTYAEICFVNLAETIICAEYGVCYGDSGAGGVRNGQLCAVVQGGCDIRHVQDKYTDVSNARVRDFITSKMTL